MLTHATLTWVRQAVSGRRALDIRQLPGSTSASLYRLDLEDKTSIVLRQFDRLPDWLALEPDLALHEARSLEVAQHAAVPTPHLLAFDERGEACGSPSVLMTCLPGAVDLNPANLEGWAAELAEALARIHATPLAAFGWHYFTYQDLSALSVPGWSSVPQHWAQAITLVQGPPPTFTPRLIHRDYHPTNVLWQAGRISGVVDWVNACSGPPGADVGHCRVNLAQMYGLEVADAFKAAYERRTGLRQEPYWDAVALFDILDGPPGVYAGWPAFGLHHLTDELIRQRLDAFLVGVLAQ